MAPAPFLDKTGMVFLKKKIANPSSIKTDETLRIKNGALSVNTTDEVALNNMLPITSNAVAVTVGNIEAILETI